MLDHLYFSCVYTVRELEGKTQVPFYESLRRIVLKSWKNTDGDCLFLLLRCRSEYWDERRDERNLSVVLALSVGAPLLLQHELERQSTYRAASQSLPGALWNLWYAVNGEDGIDSSIRSEMVQLLLQYGTDVNETLEGSSLTFWAIAFKWPWRWYNLQYRDSAADMERVDWLQPNSVEPKSDLLDLVLMFLRYGADPNAMMRTMWDLSNKRVNPHVEMRVLDALRHMFRNQDVQIEKRLQEAIETGRAWIKGKEHNLPAECNTSEDYKMSEQCKITEEHGRLTEM
jgi:hypothetical protein